jgi:hypothetical protein
MKKIALLSFLALAAFGCNSSAPTRVENQPTTNSSNRNEMTVMSHSSESVKSAPTSKASTESPMAKPIDVSAMTAKIEKAEADYKAKPNDAKAKETLASARFERAFALTEAAQYRAALGDFRKGLKLNPNDAEAKAMHDQILSIFKSINREPPKEGEEPAPLAFDGQKTAAPIATDSRITFEKGATSAIAKGALKNYDDSKTFLTELRAGQTLKTEQVKDENSTHYVTVEITDPSGKAVGDADASCNNRKEIKPTVAGNYKIRVFECKKADTWSGEFSLKVTAK